MADKKRSGPNVPKQPESVAKLMINIAELGQYIKRKRERERLTLRAVAKQTQVAASTLSRIENGAGVPDTHTLARLAKWLNIPFERAVGISFHESVEVSHEDQRERQGVPRIPYFEGAHLGSPSSVDNEPERYVNLHEEYVHPSRETYIVRVFGESMIDENIFDQDVLIIETVKNPDEVSDGAIILVNVQNDFSIKKYYRNKSTIELRSANEAQKTKYPSIFIIPKDEFDQQRADKLRSEHGENIKVIPNDEFSIQGLVKYLIRKKTGAISMELPNDLEKALSLFADTVDAHIQRIDERRNQIEESFTRTASLRERTEQLLSSIGGD